MLLENLEINPADLPSLESVTYTKHPKRYKRLRVVRVLITFFILLIPASATYFSGEKLMLIVAMSAWALLFIIVFLDETISFAIRGYVIRDHDITYRKGFLRFSMVTIPFNRIQHAEISQGPIARFFKLSTLRIYTAGGSSSDLSIGGLDFEEAQKLKDFVTRKAGTHV
jgi:uncharacterized protein